MQGDKGSVIRTRVLRVTDIPHAMLKSAGLTDTMVACVLTLELRHFVRLGPIVGPGVRGYRLARDERFTQSG